MNLLEKIADTVTTMTPNLINNTKTAISVVKDFVVANSATLIPALLATALAILVLRILFEFLKGATNAIKENREEKKLRKDVKNKKVTSPI